MHLVHGHLRCFPRRTRRLLVEPNPGEANLQRGEEERTVRDTAGPQAPGDPRQQCDVAGLTVDRGSRCLVSPARCHVGVQRSLSVTVGEGTSGLDDGLDEHALAELEVGPVRRQRSLPPTAKGEPCLAFDQ